MEQRDKLFVSFFHTVTEYPMQQCAESGDEIKILTSEATDKNPLTNVRYIAVKPNLYHTKISSARVLRVQTALLYNCTG